VKELGFLAVSLRRQKNFLIWLWIR